MEKENIFDAPATLLTQNFYQYELYTEYLKNINYYILNSKRSGIVVGFYHQNINKSTNNDNETLIHNTSKFKETIYDVYNFCPTIDTTQIMYQVGKMDNRNGFDINSNNQLTLFQLEEPLPDDLFYFYNNKEEIFKVTQVTYLQTVHDNLKLYQLQYENANVVYSSLQNFNVNETYYFNDEFDLWYPSYLYKNYVYLVNNKQKLIDTIKRKYYIPTLCYFLDVILTNGQIQEELDKSRIANEIIHLLKEVGKVDLPVLLDYKYKLDVYGYPISLTNDFYYVTDKTYIPPVNPPLVYDPFEGKIINEFLKCVYDLYMNYKPFIELKLNLKPQELIDNNINGAAGTIIPGTTN